MREKGNSEGREDKGERKEATEKNRRGRRIREEGMEIDWKASIEYNRVEWNRIEVSGVE